MKKFPIIYFLFLIIVLFFTNFHFVKAQGLNQQPTIAIPTVTGTPRGVTASVYLYQDESINVRSGPGVFFEKVGVLLGGQEAAVLGRTVGGDWVMIEYPGAPNNIGWVYAPVIQLSPGEIPIVEPPPTPTPLMTQTINPTLAAQFITTPNPTRLPTFTPVTPLVIPTYQDISRTSFFGKIPMGMVILVIGGLGVLFGTISIFKTR